MKDLKVQDIIDIVLSDVPDPADRIEKLFEWQHDRSIEVAKWLLGAGASLAVAIGVAAYRQNPPVSAQDVLVLGAGPV